MLNLRKKPSSLPGLTRQSIRFAKSLFALMEARGIGERSDAVLRTAVPAHDRVLS